MNDTRFKYHIFEISKMFVAVLGVIAFLFNPQAGTQGIINGLNLCYTSIIPSLFPFFVFSKLIMHSKYSHVLGIILAPYARYGLKIYSKSAGTAILLGLVGGFGSGGVCVQSLYEKKTVTLAQAHVLMCMIINAGPAFVVACVGTLMLNSTAAGWLIYASLCISSLITGAVFANFFLFKNVENSVLGKKNELLKKRKKTPLNPYKKESGENYIFGGNSGLKNTADSNASTNTVAVSAQSRHVEATENGKFVNCVKSAVYSTLTLCGFVVLFSFFISCISFLNLPMVLQIITTIFVEVTVACSLIASSGNAHAIYLCTAAISVMGASILLQIRSLIAPEISVLPTVISRVVHVPMALLCLRLLLAVFNAAVPASATADTFYTLRMPLDALCAAVFFFCAFFCALGKGAELKAPTQRS